MNKVMEKWQEDYIRANAHAMTAPELVEATGLKRACVYSFLYAQGITYKRTNYHNKEKTVGDVRRKRGPYKKWVPPVSENNRQIQQPPVKKNQRPPAVYSNSSPLGIANQYR